MILMDSGEITLIQHAHTLSHMSGSIYCINVKKYKKFRGQDVRKRGQDILLRMWQTERPKKAKT